MMGIGEEAGKGQRVVVMLDQAGTRVSMEMWTGKEKLALVGSWVPEERDHNQKSFRHRATFVIRVIR
jgi:hypothetical protein